MQYDLSVFELLGARPARAVPGVELWQANAPQFVFKGAELSRAGNLRAVGFAAPASRKEPSRGALIDSTRRKMIWQTGLRVSADGPTLAVGTTRVRLVDMATGTQRKIVGHRGAVTALAVHPDGHRLASGSTDSTILLWDLSRQEH